MKINLIVFVYLVLCLSFHTREDTISLPIHYSEGKRLPFLSFVQVFPLKMNEYKMPAVTMSLGTPPQTFEFLITTYSSKVYISKKDGFDCSQSLTCEDLKMKILLRFISENTYGVLTTDHIKIGSVTVRGFKFVYIIDEDLQYIYKGMLGLDYLNKNSDRDISSPVSYSFLSQLYTRGFIEKQMFFIGKFEGIPRIVFGDYPANKLSYQKYHSCDLIKKDSRGEFNILWKCTLNAIYFEDNTIFSVNEPIAFGISSNYMSVTLPFYTYIKMKFFLGAFEHGDCRESIEDTSHSIWCRESFNADYIGEISLIFGKWNIKLKGEQLWIRRPNSREKCFRLLYYYENKFTWSINYTILEDRYIMIFDRENDKLGVYDMS